MSNFYYIKIFAIFLQFTRPSSIANAFLPFAIQNCKANLHPTYLISPAHSVTGGIGKSQAAMATPVFIKVLLTVMVIGAFANACGGGCFCPANKRIPCPAGFCPGRDGRSKSLPSRLRVDITTVEEDSGSQAMKGTRY